MDYVNLEGKLISESKSTYRKRVSLTRTINKSQLKKLNKTMKNNNQWSKTKNCAWFAVKAWNSVASKKLKLKGGIIKNPASLSKQIKKHGSYKKKIAISVNTSDLYRIKKDGQKVETDGAMKDDGESSSSSF